MDGGDMSARGCRITKAGTGISLSSEHRPLTVAWSPLLNMSPTMVMPPRIH